MRFGLFNKKMLESNFSLNSSEKFFAKFTGRILNGHYKPNLYRFVHSLCNSAVAIGPTDKIPAIKLWR